MNTSDRPSTESENASRQSSVAFGEVCAEDLDSAEHLRTYRILLVIATIGLFGPALIAWSSIIQLQFVGMLATAACVVTLVLVIMIVTCKTERELDRLNYAVLGLGLVLLGSWAVTELYFYPAYGTDEAAFVQYSAQLLIHGHNPYTHNLLPALTQFRVPIQYATYKLNGTLVSSLGYPALSFLLVVPAVWLTHGVQAIISENVLFLAAEMIMIFAFLPKMYRAIGVMVILGLPFLFDYTIGGDIVTMAIPFMLVVAFRWTSTGKDGRLDSMSILRAVCLGLAASISQFPWFVAPFLFLGLWHLRTGDLGRRKGSLIVARFVAIVGATFVLINAPFIIWAPKAWLLGVLSPLDQHAIPFGQGLIDATVFFGLGGGNLDFYSYAAVFCLGALLIYFSLYFDRLWKAAFIFPSVIFLFSTRSLSEYFIMMVAMWLVSVLSPGAGQIQNEQALLNPVVQPERSKPFKFGSRKRQIRFVLLVAPVAVVVVCIALAVTSTPPLQIKLTSIETNGQFRSIWQIRALVTNRSDRSVKPHFATDASGYMTTFWNVTKGPRSLGPGKSALYTLVAPNVGSMPGVTQPFVLQAVTATPETISSSTLFTPEPFDTAISPSFVDRVIPFGKRVTLDVELRSPYGAPVHQKDVPIALGQVIYAENALIPGEAEINNSPEGQSPVIALSDKKGVATFSIVDSSEQGGNPLYFQAYVSPRHGFPYGYSEVVSVQWASASTASSG